MYQRMFKRIHSMARPLYGTRHLAIRAVLSLFLLVAWVHSAAAQDRFPAPPFVFETIDGAELALRDQRGSVVVINVWTTWCQPCLQELPQLEALHQTYADDGLVVLALSADDPAAIAQIRRIAARLELTIPVLLDVDGQTASAINPGSVYPFTIFIDRRGRVASTHEGYTPGDELEHERVIQSLLAE